MALVDIAPMTWPGVANALPGGETLIGLIVNATNEGVAAVFFVPESGVIDRVGFELANVMNAHASTQITVALRTVDITNGDPTTTLYDTANGQWQKTGSAIISNGWNWFDFTGGDGNGAATVTKGDLIALVIEMTVAGDGSEVFDVESINANVSGRRIFPYMTQDTGAGYLPQQTTAPNVVLEYATTTYKIAPELAGVETYINDDSTLERGVRFRVPFNCRMGGLIMPGWTANLINTTAVFYLMADATAPGGSRLATSPTLEDDVGPAGTVYNRWGYVRWGTAVELTANTWYRLVHLPSGGGNSRVIKIPVDSAAILTQVLGTTDFHWTEDDTASGWTDETDHFCVFFPVLDQIDNGAGGGGGVIRRIPKIIGA